MKILHLADIHLDSALNLVKDSDKRRNELLLSFCDAIEYGANNGVQAVLICGDLFDNDFASLATIQSVAHLFSSHSQMQFFVLCGNHGGTKSYDKLKSFHLPNLNFFDNQQFTCYQLEGVTVSGVELDGQDEDKYDKLNLPSDQFNIVMLHADLDSSAYGKVDLKALSNANTSYLALGHRHTFAHKKLGKMQIAYCGVLETRGFDEKADTGFVLLDTVANSAKFVKQARRKVASATVDATQAASSIELLNLVQDATRSVNRSDYLNLTFKGNLNEGVSIDFAAASIADSFFAVRIENQTTTAINLEKILSEVSLRSEFVRLTQDIEDDRLKSDIIRLGLLALCGEDCAV